MKRIYRDEQGFQLVDWGILLGIVAASTILGGVVFRDGVATAVGTLMTKLTAAVGGGATVTTW